MFNLVLALCSLVSLFISSSAQTCKSYSFTNGKTFSSCSDLPVLDSFIHFNFIQDTNVLDLAYRRTNIQPTSWIAWAINPSGRNGMIGAQSLVAYRNTRANGAVHAYTSPISSYKTMLQEGPLSFSVLKLSGEYTDNEMTIFATLALPENTTVVNHVWQDGPVNGNRLMIHKLDGDHLGSMGTLDLLSGQDTASIGGANKKLMFAKKFHGGVNMASWGILMPIGAMVARYMKIYERADPLWFRTHAIAQTTAYTVGLLGGLGTSIYMWGSDRIVTFGPHSIIGIVLFCLGFLQILALKLRPNEEHEYRKFWNLYHHATGYVVIGLSIFNIYRGLDILQPGKAWKAVYTWIIGSLGAFAVVMEILQFKRRFGG